MSNLIRLGLAAVTLTLGLHAPDVSAQQGSLVAERLHANALASFRQGRFSEAYGRLMGLADAGHPPSAVLALWMHANGPTLFGKDWDSSQQQLSDWAELAGQPAPTLVARIYRPIEVRAALQARRSTP
jgi:hypothetical protein